MPTPIHRHQHTPTPAKHPIPYRRDLHVVCDVTRPCLYLLHTPELHKTKTNPAYHALCCFGTLSIPGIEALVASPDENAETHHMISECTKIGQNGETIMISVHTEESHAAIVTGNMFVDCPYP